MSEFPVESHIPIPEDDYLQPLPPVKKVRERYYPWSKMAVGDSFFVPTGWQGYNTDMLRNRLKNAVKQRRRTGLGSYTMRTVIRNGQPGIRVWRVA